MLLIPLFYAYERYLRYKGYPKTVAINTAIEIARIITSSVYKYILLHRILSVCGTY